MDLSALLSRLQFAFAGLAAWPTTIEALHLIAEPRARRIVFEFGTNWSERSRVRGKPGDRAQPLTQAL